MATIHINSSTDLQNMASGLSDDYIIDNNLDMESFSWVPVGTIATPFTGSLDGKGFNISNLSFTAASQYGGIFGHVNTSSTIKNINIVNPSIHGNDSVTYEGIGSLIGYLKSGTVDSCTVTGGTIIEGCGVGVEDGNGDCGGLIGISSGTALNRPVITNCSSSCNIFTSFESGGLIGYAKYTDISNSHATGDITGKTGYAAWFLGGFIGAIDDGTIIDNCYSTGEVIGTWDVGGFAGFMDNRFGNKITNCYSTGDVYGRSIDDNCCFFMGGFIGYSTYIEDSYSTGDVIITGDGSYNIGGFSGFSEYGPVTGCHSTGTITIRGSNKYEEWDQTGHLYNVNDIFWAYNDYPYSGVYTGSPPFWGEAGGITWFQVHTEGSNVYLVDIQFGEDTGFAATNCLIISEPEENEKYSPSDNPFDIGGFSGELADVEVFECYSTSSININANDSFFVGGFCGECYGNNTYSTKVSKCYSTGDITSISDLDEWALTEVGGFCGETGTYGYILNCYSEGSLSITGEQGQDIGGFCGDSFGENRVYNSYSSGEVVVIGNDNDTIGGFIGSQTDETILQNCYSVGEVTITGNNNIIIGGFIGISYAVDCILNCAWFTSSYSIAIGKNGSPEAHPTHPPVDTLSEISAGTDETDNAKFYIINHVVYDQGNANAWDFATPIWYAHETKYPDFTILESLVFSINFYSRTVYF